MNGQFMQYATLKPVAVPADLNGAAVTGARVSLKEGERVAIALSFGDSVAAVASITLKQHNAAAGGTTKDLEVKNPYYTRLGAETVFTKVEPTVAAATYNLSADLAAQEGVVVFEVEAQDLDVNGGFTHVSVNVADSTAAKLMSGMYIYPEPKNKPCYNVAI